MTSIQELTIRLLFECCQAPKSRLTRPRLVESFGVEVFEACRASGDITAGHCDTESSKTPWFITLKGRDTLRKLNNASAQTHAQ